MQKLLIFSFLIVSAFILNACGSSRTLDAHISSDYNRAEKYSSICLVKDDSSFVIPEQEKIDYFETHLQKSLYDDVGYKEGNDLTLKYRLVSYNEGNRFERWFMGGLGGSGKASIIVEASFINKKGVVIGKIKTQGKIGAGFFGGSFDYAIQNTAEEISHYASQFCSVAEK